MPNIRSLSPTIAFAIAIFAVPGLVLAEAFDTTIKPLLQKYCTHCHGLKGKINGEVDFTKINSQADVDSNFELWETATSLVSAGSMPPKDHLQPNEDEKRAFATWYNRRFIESVEGHPGYFRARRLSAYEYGNTLHSLFGFELEVAVVEAEQTVAEKSLVMKLLPIDPPGASGFKNDTSGNPLTTVIWDQYSVLTENGLAKLFSPSFRDALEAYTGKVEEEHLTPEQAERMLRSFVPRAYRRQIDEKRLARSFDTINGKMGAELETALRVELKIILMSPEFLYRGLLMEVPHDEQHAVDNFELAERLSYFLWGDMPDQQLMQLAAKGELGDPTIYHSQIDRMLKSPKARNLAEDFGRQWFSLGEIADLSDNVPLADALLSQPLDYLNYLFTEGRPLIELIDSDFAFVNPFTVGFYPLERGQMQKYSKPRGIEVERLPNQRIGLQNTPERGGLLTMPGVLAMNRGPVQRGTWILERVLGEHLPDPPADVGQVPENPRGKNDTFRQRFELHRSNPTCAVCHDKVDPLGFSLDQYDIKGAFIAQAKQSTLPIDASGRLPSGETFDDFQELQKILVTSQRERVIRNIVKRTLAYALARKLEFYDQPAVESIVQKLCNDNSTFHDLFHQIAESLPFRETVVRSN